jgi:hypothetical protein
MYNKDLTSRKINFNKNENSMFKIDKYDRK